MLLSQPERAGAASRRGSPLLVGSRSSVVVQHVASLLPGWFKATMSLTRTGVNRIAPIDRNVTPG
jgi:hypothetical protein